MLQNVSIQAGITPHLTNHCIRVTLITFLSEARFEGKDIRSITGHKSNTSLESYTGSESFGKHVKTAENQANFIDEENIHSALCTNMENMILDMAQTTPDQRIPQPTLQSWPSRITENRLYLRSSGLMAPVNNFHGCSVQINYNMNPTINETELISKGTFCSREPSTTVSAQLFITQHKCYYCQSIIVVNQSRSGLKIDTCQQRIKN